MLIDQQVKKQKRTASSEGVGEENRRQCFCPICCLPAELLSIILTHLSVLDYISFRAVRKCWRAAFERCPVVALENQARKQLPWFLILRTEDPYELEYISRKAPPLLYTTGKFGELSSRHIFSTDIPELCGTRILRSKHGWLLLYSSSDTLQSLFFFNPFSRARIDLPFMRLCELCRPVLDISEPPTSPGCVLFVISWAKHGFKVSLCKRGESAWTTKVYKLQGLISPISNAFFANGIWYCLHAYGDISTFDVASRNLKFLGRPKFRIFSTEFRLSCSSREKCVSFVVKRNDEFFLCIHNIDWYEISLRDPLNVVQSSHHSFLDDGMEILLRTDVEKAILQLRDELAIDSFSADAWCAECDADNVISFRWHRFLSYLDHWFHALDVLDVSDCHILRSNCSTVIMWVEPTWVHSSPDLSWTL